MRVLSGLEVVEARVQRLQGMTRQVRGLLGEQGLSELAGYIRARREAGRLVAEGGMDAALALHETRGNVAQAQAMLSKARPGATGSSTAKGSPRAVSAEAVVAGREHLGSLAAWVDEPAGLTAEVMEAKLAAEELESTSQRLSKNVAVLEKQRPSLEAPPPEAQGNPRWSEYVAYYERRLAELRQGTADKGPLRWEAYEPMWRGFTRGLDFERLMVKLLKEDAALPRAQRRFLGDFDKPRIETYVGVKKPGTGLRFADVLVIEEGEIAGQSPRIETFSLKSRDLSGLLYEDIRAQMTRDANEALRKYGETVDIRRDSLQSLLRQGSEVSVSRVRLVYEGGNLIPKNRRDWRRAVKETKTEIPKVDVQAQ